MFVITEADAIRAIWMQQTREAIPARPDAKLPREKECMARHKGAGLT
jgi:hypothetical protein